MEAKDLKGFPNESWLISGIDSSGGPYFHRILQQFQGRGRKKFLGAHNNAKQHAADIVNRLTATGYSVVATHQRVNMETLLWEDEAE